ncbi:LysR family transcriptional regulator [Xylophilus sp.]|uniref:LysR family transcriptional regulator n=1 Tax=Xylophilus sp. TaxID=2653893 RepID=UPI0013B72E60|nr:LysR family transcriptional regulator [Xylophilus sp.]KAF1044952.1 MAG: HTH-type transcriptional regulator DmlR [Xylophilus sp.]
MGWDFNSMRIFVLVAQTHSLSAAAEALELTPSTVSKAMTRMEADLGVRLLHRTTRFVHLTAEGVEFLTRCQAILQELDNATMALSNARSVPQGRLRVLVPVGFGRQVVVPSLLEFRRRHPAVVLDVELSDRRPDMAHEGLDAVVGIGPPADAGLVAHRLGQYRWLACASPAYLAEHGEPRTPADLADHHCLSYAFPQSQNYREWRFTKGGRTFTQAISGHLNINHAESLMEFAIAGAGIVQVSTFVTAAALRQGTLRAVLTDYASWGPEIHIAYPPNRNQSARVRAFIEFLQEVTSQSLGAHESVIA